jgi:translation initiation factor RLI1
MESGRAVQFISVDPDSGEFRIEEEAAAILEESENQIAIVAIAGKYRTGKSLLMNLLSGSTENNFEVSSSVKA